MIKNIAMLIVLYVITATMLTYYYISTSYAVSVLFGGTMMLVNLAGLAYFWRLILNKKSIALAIFVIIFKYVILGMMLWSLTASAWLKPSGFLLGIASLIVAIVVATVKKTISAKIL